MKIEINVKPNAKAAGIVQTGPRAYRVAVQASPTDGKANEAVVKLLAAHFGVNKSSVRIVSGHASRRKIVEIPFAQDAR